LPFVTFTEACVAKEGGAVNPVAAPQQAVRVLATPPAEFARSASPDLGL
jgi:hypothetical protein